jgi:putative ABC transport system permease protein
MAEAPLAFRLAARSLARRPIQPLVAALVLGVAVAAAGLAAVAAYDTLLRPSPYVNADRVLVVRDANDLLSSSALETLRGATTFDAVSGYAERTSTLRDGANTRQIRALAVDDQFFRVLGVRPSRGRWFDSADVTPGAAPTAIVREGFASLGTRLVLDAEPHTVIGVMPRAFAFPREVVVWVPNRSPTRTALGTFMALGHIAPAVSLSSVAAELRLLSQRRNAERPASAPRAGYHTSLLVDEARAGIDSSFWMTLVAAGFILLLTAGTLTNLFLARAIARTRDIAVNAALGASMRALIAQQLVESSLVSLTGAGIGVVLGMLAIPMLPIAIVVDWRMLLAIAVAGVLFATLLGIAPAVQFRGRNINTLLRAGAGGITTSRGQRRVRAVLVTSEIALVMFLVISAGVIGKLYVASERIDWGYDTRHTLFGIVTLPQSRFASTQERLTLARDVAGRLRGLGVGSATVFGEAFPGWVPENITPFAELDGYSGTRRSGPAFPMLLIDTDSSYLDAMGLKLLRGRWVSERDRVGADPVAVIDQKLAEFNWPGKDPLGHHIRFNAMEPDGPWYTIVGVVANETALGGFGRLDKAGAYRGFHPRVMYRSLAQTAVTWPEGTKPGTAGFAFAIHTSGDPMHAASAVRRALSDVAPDQPVTRFGTLHDYMNINGASMRETTSVFGLLGALGLALSILGIVSLVTDTVVRRRREIGIRITLGARWPHIFGIVLDESTKLACAGVVMGLILSGVLVKVLGHFIPVLGLHIDDPTLIVSAAATVLVLVSLAALGPALAALRVVPTIALQAD